MAPDHYLITGFGAMDPIQIRHNTSQTQSSSDDLQDMGHHGFYFSVCLRDAQVSHFVSATGREAKGDDLPRPRGSAVTSAFEQWSNDKSPLTSLNKKTR